MTDSGLIDIRDVAMRDGLQIAPPISLVDKLRLLDAILATGVRFIELTAFVSPRKVPSLADAKDLAAAVNTAGPVHFSALVASVNGAARAIEAGITTLEYVVSAAEAHSCANVGRDSAAATALIAPIAELVSAADGSLEVIVATAWDCPFDGPTPPARVESIVRSAVGAGAARVSLADTIGTAAPGRVEHLIALTRDLLPPDIPLGAHFHNTRGMGIANALASVRAGVTFLDASIGGLGGCPFAPGASGNIATEELVYMLHDSGYRTSLDLAAAISAAKAAETIVGGTDSGLRVAGDRQRVRS